MFSGTPSPNPPPVSPQIPYAFPPPPPPISPETPTRGGRCPLPNATLGRGWVLGDIVAVSGEDSFITVINGLDRSPALGSLTEGEGQGSEIFIPPLKNRI